MARLRRVEGVDASPLQGSWRCARAAPGAVESPGALDAAGLEWMDAPVPGTVASALRRRDDWRPGSPDDLDAFDWWFRCRFSPPVPTRDGRDLIHFDGLATLADAWLDGRHVLRSENMFHEHRVDVTGQLRESAELVLCFSSVGAALEKKRPRPRWRATLVARQQLRWLRTSLIGRIPSWSPGPAVVGPYRPVRLERGAVLELEADLRARHDGRDGLVHATLRIGGTQASRVDAVTLLVEDLATELALSALQPNGYVKVAGGSGLVKNAELWWPFTHGDPRLYRVRAVVHSGRERTEVELGRIGFRKVELDTTDGDFRISVNGVDVFCRGACWMPLDPVSLQTDKDSVRSSLLLAKAAGMNMMRLCGPTVYETDAFYDACDELGILVWQDFMFAGLDYPVGDDAFAKSVEREAAGWLDSRQTSPCVAVLCGNTELAQQVAMLGLPEELARNDLFDARLPALAARLRPDVPYVTSTPSGGSPPFRIDTGVSHYYGVGAYGRPIEDARRAGVRFSAECLAFANVPVEETAEELLPDGEAPGNSPRWKSAVPRDRGVAWDFDDVRDHYLASLFREDPVLHRRSDWPRYLELGRVVTGEVMSAVMSEWRRARSGCHGALVWFFRDLVPGAGWGLVDARGRPKSSYYALKRVLQPVALVVTDEGLNGVRLAAINETAGSIEAAIDISLIRLPGTVVDSGRTTVTLAPRSTISVTADELLGHFVDVSQAYLFGPPAYDVAIATLTDASDGGTLGRAHYFPHGPPTRCLYDPGLVAEAERAGDSAWSLSIRSAAFAFAVAIDAPGFCPEDNYFHLGPGEERRVTVRGDGRSLRWRVKPLNAASATVVKVASRPA